MEPALKQRLIGAAVLVVLAVIFVPMVFDGSKSVDTQTVDLSIPATPDREFETRVVPLETAPQGGTAISEPDPNRIATVDTAAPDRPDALAGNEPPEVAEPAAPQPAAPATPAPAASEPAVAAPDQPDAAPAPAPQAGGRYIVSFGSYSKAENATALVTQLERGGIPARAENAQVNGKPGMRVRAGPYAMRGEAESVRLLATRVRADVPASIVEVDDTPTADAPPAPAGAKPGGWAVQVGAFQTESDAIAQRDKLSGAGYAAFVDPVRAAGGTLYRVRIGPELVRANADRLRDELKSRFQLDGLVVNHP